MDTLLRSLIFTKQNQKSFQSLNFSPFTCLNFSDFTSAEGKTNNIWENEIISIIAPLVPEESS